MNVTLPPDLEQFLHQLVQEGRYGSADEAVCLGLALLREQEESLTGRLEELRREVAIGLEQADRGELIDGGEVFRELRQKLRNDGNGRP